MLRFILLLRSLSVGLFGGDFQDALVRVLLGQVLKTPKQFALVLGIDEVKLHMSDDLTP